MYHAAPCSRGATAVRDVSPRAGPTAGFKRKLYHRMNSNSYQGPAAEQHMFAHYYKLQVLEYPWETTTALAAAAAENGRWTAGMQEV